MAQVLRKWKAKLNYQPTCQSGVTLDLVKITHVEGVGIFFGQLADFEKVFYYFFNLLVLVLFASKSSYHFCLNAIRSDTENSFS